MFRDVCDIPHWITGNSSDEGEEEEEDARLLSDDLTSSRGGDSLQWSKMSSPTNRMNRMIHPHCEGQLRRSPSCLNPYVAAGEDGVPFWITVEGPIGAGKTELMKILVPSLEREYGEGNVVVVKENIELMMERGTFQRSQKDPVRYTYQAQTMWFHRRTTDWLRAWNKEGGKTARVIISERSIFSDSIFMATTHRKGYVEDHELSDYLELHSMWVKIYPIWPGLILYCRAGESTEDILNLCDARIRERNREAETELVDKSYNAIVLEEHEKKFGDPSRHHSICIGHDTAEIPVLCMDTTENYRDNELIALKKSAEVLDSVRLHMGSSNGSSSSRESPSPPLDRDPPGVRSFPMRIPRNGSVEEGDHPISYCTTHLRSMVLKSVNVNPDSTPVVQRYYVYEGQ